MTHPLGNALGPCFVAALSGLLFVGTLTSAAQENHHDIDWPQWGGAQRNFVAPPVALDAWPPEGPKVLWRRPLGEGYSAISAVAGSLYTQVRDGDSEIVLAVDATDGTTRWQHRYEAPILEGMAVGHGRGPHSTPLVVDGKVFAIGSTGRMHGLRAESGEVLWQRDLWGEMGGTVLRRGYGASPLAWNGAVIITLGGKGQGLAALDQTTGEVLWKRQDLDNSPSSPLLIEVDGHQQLVAFVNDEVVAVDPRDGDLLWRHRHPSGAAYNISTPLWDPERHLLFLSSAYGGGGRVLRLGTTAEGGAEVTEVWHHSRFNLHFTNGVLLGDHVYGSSGRVTVYLQAVDLRDGAIAWRERAIDRANFVVAGDRVLALESEGRLLLLGLSPEHPSIYSQMQLFPGKAWTLPTLAGQYLYARNNEELVALELPLRSSANSLSP